jgi:hypothetical protein
MSPEEIQGMYFARGHLAAQRGFRAGQVDMAEAFRVHQMQARQDLYQVEKYGVLSFPNGRTIMHVPTQPKPNIADGLDPIPFGWDTPARAPFGLAEWLAAYLALAGVLGALGGLF